MFLNIVLKEGSARLKYIPTTTAFTIKADLMLFYLLFIVICIEFWKAWKVIGIHRLYKLFLGHFHYVADQQLI